jgi:hypothetical protein
VSGQGGEGSPECPLRYVGLRHQAVVEDVDCRIALGLERAPSRRLKRGILKVRFVWNFAFAQLYQYHQRGSIPCLSGQFEQVVQSLRVILSWFEAFDPAVGRPWRRFAAPPRGLYCRIRT